MKSKSFYEVLENQIRADLTEELRCEIRNELLTETPNNASASPAERADSIESFRAEYLEVWLATHLSHQKKSASRSSPYGKKSASTGNRSGTQSAGIAGGGAPTEKFRAHFALTSQEASAIELLNRYGAKLEAPFSENELRRAWRKAANQTHPDRFVTAALAVQAEMSMAFCAVTEAAELLENCLKLAA